MRHVLKFFVSKTLRRDVKTHRGTEAQRHRGTVMRKKQVGEEKRKKMKKKIEENERKSIFSLPFAESTNVAVGG